MSTQGDSISRLWRAVCALSAAALIAVCGCAAPEASPGSVLHREPSSVREQYDAWLLFAHLGGVLQAVASEQFDLADEQLSAVRSQQAHLPSGLVDLAVRYASLCRELTETIESLYDSLKLVDDLLALNDLSGAGRALAVSRSLLAQAQEQLEALQRATAEVFTLLRRSGSGTATAQLNEARESLELALDMLARLTLLYDERAASAEATTDARQTLQLPQVSLQLSSEAAWVGETVRAFGAIEAAGVPLADRELLLLIDGDGHATANSNDRGEFSLEVQVPHEYVPLRTLQVAYRSGGEDLSRFQSAASDEAVLTVRFHQSVMVVEPPRRLYPGWPSAVTGTVESAGNVAERQVEVIWKDKQVGNALTDARGDFECSVMLPDDAAVGSGALHLLVVEDNEALTGPCAADVDVDVAKLALSVEVSVERLLFVPGPSLSLPRQLARGDFTHAVTVSGQVGSSLPLGSVVMRAQCGDRQIQWQQRDGAFEREMPLEISIWSMGVQTITVSAVPQEPWHRPGEARAGLLVVNLFVPFVWLTALVLALLLGVAFRSRRRARGARSVLPEEVRTGHGAGWPFAEEEMTEEAAFAPRSLLVGLYYRAVAFLQSAFGVMLRREMTLREYLREVVGGVPRGAEPFAALTALAERALYGRHEPDSRDISASRGLVETLRKESGARSGGGQEEDD